MSGERAPEGTANQMTSARWWPREEIDLVVSLAARNVAGHAEMRAGVAAWYAWGRPEVDHTSITATPPMKYMPANVFLPARQRARAR